MNKNEYDYKSFFDLHHLKICLTQKLRKLMDMIRLKHMVSYFSVKSI